MAGITGITGLVSSCYILMLILTVVHCNERESWTTRKGNHSSILGEYNLSYSHHIWSHLRHLGGDGK